MLGLVLLCAVAALSEWLYGAIVLPVALFGVMLALCLRGLVYSYPHGVLGACNAVTLGRAALVAVLSGAIVALASGWVIFAIAVAAFALDGLNGWLARRARLCSAFGARFDMEIDALLGAVLALVLLVNGTVGPAILVLGFARYGFVLAGFVWPALQGPLTESFRRKAICVLQIAALIFLMFPLTPSLLVLPLALGGGDCTALFLCGGCDLSDAAAGMKQAILPAVGAALLFAVLALPNHPDALAWSALGQLPLELPVLLLGMLAVGHRWGVAAVLALVLVAVTFLKLADMGVFLAYNRTFNPVLDTFLIKAGIGLLGESIGRPLTYLALVAVVLGMVALFYLLWRSLRAWGRGHLPPLPRAGAAVAALGFGGWAVADAGHHLGYWTFEKSPYGTARTSQLAVKRGVDVQATMADLRQFKLDAQHDVYAGATGLLDRLRGHDVIMIYIESYGRASFDNPLYAPTHTATLASAQQALMQAGFAAKSGWLTSPTAGGQSWLAHGTLATGLWTADQGRYIAMLASGKKSLFHIAQESGFRTAAFMPAITMAWPESSAMGFDLVFAAADIPYKGDRFNWVTMPDQFTLATYDGLLPDDPRQDFIQIALISSHAPWVPVPDMVAWKDVGDGTIFNEMAARGPTPRELWKNRDDVREAYRRAIDYALQATFAHVSRLGDAAPLMVIVGDHQSAGFVAGSDNRDVPVHLVGPPDIVAHVNGWDWSDGLIPAPDVPVRRMDSFRDAFIGAFSGAVRLTEVQQ